MKKLLLAVVALFSCVGLATADWYVGAAPVVYQSYYPSTYAVPASSYSAGYYTSNYTPYTTSYVPYSSYYSSYSSYYRPYTSYYAPATSYSTYYAPATSYSTYYTPTTTYYAPSTSYYSPAAPVYSTYYAPVVGAAVVPRAGVISSKVYYPGQPVRNFFKALAP